MKPKNPIAQDIPLNMVGGTHFGRYPKISLEQTWNMIISDGFLVPYAGYDNVNAIAPNAVGRGIITSTINNVMIVVISNVVYLIAPSLAATRVGTLTTFTGEVYLSQNNGNQVAISDNVNIYVYNFNTGDFTIAPISFSPGYLTFQDGYGIVAVNGTNSWQLSDPNDFTSWPGGPSNVGFLQTKPDNVVAVQHFPGRGNLLFVMGNTVTEAWFDTGSQLFPYERSSGYNIDYGCVSPSTIAHNEKFIVWLGANEKSGPVIMYSDGSDVKRISNDGIDFKLAELKNPSDSNAFLFRQDGHLIYQLTFTSDNFSIIYDFNTEKIFNVSDQFQNYHIALRVAFFNNEYYFVSLNDGNLYQMSSDFYDYDGAIIPRIRICTNIRLPDASPFVVNSISLTLEQGSTTNTQRVDLSFSKNSGYNFSSSYGKYLNPQGVGQNRLIFWQLGQANDFIPQFQFWGDGRFVVGEGIASIYQ